MLQEDAPDGLVVSLVPPNGAGILFPASRYVTQGNGQTKEVPLPDKAVFGVIVHASLFTSGNRPSASIILRAYRKNAPNDVKQHDKIILYLIGSQPASGGTLWFYGSRPGGPAWNWNVTKRLGRYVIGRDTEYTINKRQQIAALAKHWAEVWPLLGYPYQTISYPFPLPRRVKPARAPRPLFAGCDGFVDYIYGKLGLVNLGTSRGPGPLPDNGIGAFRSFRSRSSPANGSSFVHVSILVGGGEIVDDNNTADSRGPTKRQGNFGTPTALGSIFWGGSNPEDRSYPDPVVPGQTQLQVLDGE